MKHPINLSKTKFGKLSPINHLSIFTKNGRRSYWECKCDCGTTKNIRTDHLLHKNLKSCGCDRNINDCWERGIYNGYKINAEARNKNFELSFDFFKKEIHNNCYYCNISPISGKDNLYNGIDRKDNNMGYEESNCVSCCKICNFMKRDMDFNKFISWIKQIGKYSNSINFNY